MAMYTNSVPFTLQLEQGRTTKTGLFTIAEGNITEDTCIVIRENIDVYVLFQSENETCRLYIEGLESITMKGEMEEEAEAYLRPSASKRLLFSHDQFPIIPGDYIIRVMCGISYYMMLRVLPKQITTGQLQFMKEEIEGFLEGLAYERVQKSGMPIEFPHFNLPLSYTSNYFVVKAHVSRVCTAMLDLMTKVNYSLKKEKPLRSKAGDEKDFLFQKAYPARRKNEDVVTIKCDYDLPENRYLKKMVLFLYKELLFLMQMGENLLNELPLPEMKKEEQFLVSSLHSIKRLLRVFICMQRVPWFIEIKTYETSMPPHRLHADARYRAIFQLYRQYKHNQDTLKEGTQRWKRTDKLYEIWGFLQFLHILTKTMDYEPLSGWLYSEVKIGSDPVPTLEKNTKILLQKDAVCIHLFYEGEIALDAVETSLENPLYTESTSNRPDMRMDVFLNRIYMGSLLFDFKYRPLHHIWDVTRVKHKTVTMRKLSQYVLSCKSHYLFGMKEARYVRPVHEVWAIHPNVHKEYPVSKKLENHDLRIVQLSPTYSSSHIADNLTNAIHELIRKQSIFSLLTV